MSIRVTTNEKKQFISKMLMNYSFKAIQSERILNYLLKDDTLLQLTHFVTTITGCPRAISISTTDVQNESIVFYKKTIKSSNGWQAYHDLRLNNDEQLFIKINMPQPYDNTYYKVLEKNPFKLESNDDNHFEQTILKQQMNFLKQQIDFALDQEDKETFFRLTNKLKEIQQN